MDKSAALKPEVVLQPHQARLAEEAEGQSIRKLLVHGLGSGKSLSSLAVAETGGKPYTVAAPASLRQNYRTEIEKHTDQQTPADVMSYNALAQGKPVDKLHTLIADESQRLRNPESKATQRFLDLADQAKQLVMLSGTPIVNQPSDLAVPISALTGNRMSPEEFDSRFVGTKKVKPSIFQRLMGVTPGEEPAVAHPDELKALLKGHVDYFAPDKSVVPVNHQDIETEMTTPQSRLYRAMWGELPWVMRWKMKHDFPMSREELAKMRSFMVGPRQVGLSTLPYLRNKDPLKAFGQSSKLQKAFELLQDKLKDDRTRALVFSNFIDAGLTPYSAALNRAGVQHGMFHGGLSDPERKRLVEDFNNGKTRVALLGPSGAEGLSFKGTQLIQLLDPHFHSTRGRQAEGRGLRFDSHMGLPEDLQNVTVQRFISKLPLGFKDKLLSSLGFDRSHNQHASDHYLQGMAANKDRTNQQFLDILKEVGSQHKQAEANFRKLDSTQSQLHAAKEHSDAHNWPAKHAILSQLITAKPHDWKIDSDTGGHVVGVSHKSGWRYHLPRHLVPAALTKSAEEEKSAGPIGSILKGVGNAAAKVPGAAVTAGKGLGGATLDLAAKVPGATKATGGWVADQSRYAAGMEPGQKFWSMGEGRIPTPIKATANFMTRPQYPVVEPYLQSKGLGFIPSGVRLAGTGGALAGLGVAAHSAYNYPRTMVRSIADDMHISPTDPEGKKTINEIEDRAQSNTPRLLWNLATDKSDLGKFNRHVIGEGFIPEQRTNAAWHRENHPWLWRGIDAARMGTPAGIMSILASRKFAEPQPDNMRSIAARRLPEYLPDLVKNYESNVNSPLAKVYGDIAGPAGANRMLRFSPYNMLGQSFDAAADEKGLTQNGPPVLRSYLSASKRVLPQQKDDTAPVSWWSDSTGYQNLP